jgi:hypothetical protein
MHGLVSKIQIKRARVRALIVMTRRKPTTSGKTPKNSEIARKARETTMEEATTTGIETMTGSGKQQRLPFKADV